jgi:GDP-4-dehydro-6-deoxy-D-mannose reductase
VRVLILGGSGFVGAHLARACVEAGDVVFATGRDPESSPRLRELGALVQPLRVEVTDEATVLEAIERARPERVFHLAGEASVARSFADEESVLRTNVLGTLHVLRAVRAKAPEARVLYVGSGEEYGRVPLEEQPIREDAPLRPVSPYGVSRVSGSLVALRAVLAEGLHVVRTRSFNHTGAGQSTAFAVPSWAAELVSARLRGAKRTSVKTGELSLVRDFSGVRAVASAYRALLEKGASGEVYNVCSGRAVTLAEILARLGEIARVEPLPETDPGRLRRAEIAALRGDPSRLEAATGLSLAGSLDRELTELVGDLDEKLRR